MSVLFTLLISALALAAGFFLGRQSAPGKQEAGELKNQLAGAEKSLSDYRQDVNQHFQQTAHLLGRLTENHRNLYQHLALGAQDLTHEGQAGRLYRPESLGLTQRDESPAGLPIAAEAVTETEHAAAYAAPGGAQAPRDYSPYSHGIMGQNGAESAAAERA